MMSKKRVFITGSTGCIGHYVLDKFVEDPDFELHLLVRDPKKFLSPYVQKSNIHIHLGELESIEKHKEILSQCEYLIHIATAWGDSDLSSQLNKDKTHEMLSYLNPEKLERIV